MKWKILASLFLLVGAFFFAKGIFAQSNDEKLNELSAQIKQYEAEIQRLQSQGSTLANQIAQFDTQIKLAELKISETEEKIALLGGRISELQLSLEALTTAFNSRAVKTYKMSRLSQEYAWIFSSDISSAVSSYHYLQRIQEADRDLLGRLDKAKVDYQGEKLAQEELQAKLEKNKKTLDYQKAAKANLLSQTKNDEKKYQQLLSQARSQLEAFKRFISSSGGASILSGQTKCDSWGCYYNQRDSEWGNMFIGNSNSSLAEYGCLVTSVAMVSSHYGKNLKPSNIAASPEVFFGNTAYMLQGSWSTNGVGVTRTRVCDWCSDDTKRAKIDEEVNAGRPVIVGLYSGPDHFIVLKGKSGDNYIMNDPFMENGGDRQMSEKYSISDIRTVDFVRIN